MDDRLEERYVVLKLSHLTAEQQAAVYELCLEHGIESIDCVVVEHDWPIYPEVVDRVLELAARREDGSDSSS